MKALLYLAAFAVALVIVLVVRESFGGPKFRVGDHVMPIGSSNPETILKIVAVEPKSYKVFTYFLSKGHLVLAEDYTERPRALIDRSYIKVPAPTVEGTFSPDKWLSEHTSATPASPSPR